MCYVCIGILLTKQNLVFTKSFCKTFTSTFMQTLSVVKSNNHKNDTIAVTSIVDTITNVEW